MRALLYSKRTAARLIGVSERTLHTLISEKKIAVRRIGRRVLIPDAELVEFAQSEKSQPGPSKDRHARSRNIKHADTCSKKNLKDRFDD
jgi:excisionase family DNA binding protein